MPHVRNILARTPEWIRHDLLSKEATSRERAEEALTAMVVAALDQPVPAAARG